MGVFDSIENVAAEGTSSRQYYEPGNYVVTVDSVILYERRMGGGKLFIVETTVNESDNPYIKPGEQRNWVQSFGLYSALPRIKSFIGAAKGLCPKKQLKEINNKITAAICDESVGPANPLSGKRLRLTCVKKITTTGKEFVQHTWGVMHG
jgi:hypothetical protein